MKILVLVVAILLNGCALAEPEIRYKNATLISKSDYLDLFEQDESPFYFDQYLPSQKFLLVDLTSNKDLILMASKNSLKLYANAFICDRPNAKILLSVSDVFYQNKSSDVAISELPDLYSSVGSESSHKIFDYRVILNTSNQFNINYSQFEEDPKYYEKFDLVSDPQDICISIQGSGFYFYSKSMSSNTIVLNKKLIGDLLEK